MKQTKFEIQAATFGPEDVGDISSETWVHF
jgi:hypothetical protein